MGYLGRSPTPSPIDSSDIPDNSIDASKIIDGSITLADLGTLNDVSLAAYNNTTAITGDAVDVFIYDTSNDSDGGAWRKRTQATSWYNETLNTSTRGSRKEFPSVAVIVAEASKVTIYDGDTPDLDMWMVISAGGIIDWATSTQTRIAVSALNGIVTTACGDGGHLFRFIDDTTYILYNSLSYNVTSDRSIANRNGATTYTSTGGVVNTYRVIHYAMNDVAMTVLPNAPIDSATGLPIPTIAVATDAGVSVIKDDGNVWDITGTDGNNTCTAIWFDDNNELWFKTSQHVSIGGNTIPSSDVSNYGIYNFFRKRYFYLTAGGIPPVPAALNNTSNFGIAKDTHIAGYTGGLNLLKQVDEAPETSSVAYITSNYNSGYMTGDIKGAWLADTDTTNVVGTELITNGTFDTDTTGWTATDATVSVAAGVLSFTPAAAVNGFLSRTITTVIGKNYVASVDVVDDALSRARIYVGTTTKGNDLGSQISIGVGQGSVSFIATTTTTHITLVVGGGDGQLTKFDNASTRLADADRSVNANGLQVNGTITKTAVATGAELVGYSGFSTSNYLQQPYNADLDFGTGDYSIMCWLKTVYTTTQSLFHIGPPGSSGYFYMQIVAGIPSLFHTTNAGWSQVLAFSATVNTGEFTFLTISRSSGVVSATVNGEAAGSVSNSTTLTIPNAVFTLGRRNDLAEIFHGSLALWRISATAPTAAQIKEIYDAEKPLFQKNAKCTLNGASDAVQCLAYDDSTELLHVGTSGGRSTFQGLRRVDETATNTTEISAQGGMIIEETA